ncbi:hypothetical protein R75465_07527 [Paraburkholderia aspalathi]|uniref:hypothetical protein n=1 Tax=Paraburkholderia aspalathi TaxID=1324617 RepID=UPI001B0B800D|nr:hypothetical protein [Paraburkholderia aspalathi]CAE6858372.1 hypothetical protein R75465_07527 [Paraburkholderia aspalathi]
MARKEPMAGFGQSFWEDLRFLLRFWRRRRRVISWRVPSDVERQEADVHPIVERFGDQTQLVADVGKERWLVRDRDWWGWPDPHRYVFFVLKDDRIVVAADFTAWPVSWEPNPDKIGAVDVP